VTGSRDKNLKKVLGSGFKEELLSINHERVIPPGRETFEPISLQSFNPEGELYL
jgi:hypothetical protein